MRPIPCKAVFVLFALLAIASNPLAAANIGACGNLTTAGENYTLTSNVSIASSICFRVQAANVTLDCNGFSIIGGNATGNYGVYTNQNNTTIKNCIIGNISTGIYLNRTINATISNVTAISTSSKANDENGNGIYMQYANFSVISGVNVSSAVSAGIRIIATSCNNTISSSSIYAGTDVAIYFDSASNNNTLSGSTVSASSSGMALGMALSSRNNFIDSTFSSATGNPVRLFASSNNNVFVNNTLISTGGAANLLFLDATGGASTGNYFALNNFTATSGYYIRDTSGSNIFNYSVYGINQGNIYYNVMNGSVAIIGSNSSTISGLYIGTSGSGYPYSTANSGGKLSGTITDAAPLTSNRAALNCSNLSAANTIQNLTQNVSISGATCFNITAANVTLDCKGYSITGNNASGTYGIYAAGANATIRNCIVSNFYQILGSYAAGTRITNTSATSSYCNALDLYNSTGAVISNVTLTKLDSTCSVLAIATGSNATIENSTLTGVNGIWTASDVAITGARIVNNSFSCPSSSQCANLGTLTSGFMFALNNFTGAGTYIVDNNGSNNYNMTIYGSNQGNIYANVVNGAVNITGSASSSVSGFYRGSGGSGYPYNSTHAGGKLTGTITDYAPLTPFYAAPPSVPNITSISISPLLPTNTSTLSCAVNVTDAGYANFSLNISWQKNGTNYSSAAYNATNGTQFTANLTLNTSITQDGDIWRCLAWANNSANFSAISYSQNATVGSVISSCGNLSAANTAYILSSSLSATGSTCLRITADNVTIDCNGYRITGSNASGTYGIFTNRFNTTIRNCNISNFATGIVLNGSANSTVSNVSSATTCNQNGGRGDGDGIYMQNADFNSINGTNTSSIAGIGIRLVSGSCNNTITSSAGYSARDVGIYIDTSSNGNTGTGLNASSSTGTGFGMALSSQNTISNSTFSSGSYYALRLFASSLNNRFVNNTLISTGGASNLAYMDATGGASTSNYFALNNFTSTSGYYIRDTSGSNYYNYTVNGINQGNIYYNVLSGASQVAGSVQSSVSTLYVGDSGSAYPYKSTNSLSKIYGSAIDYAPLTPSASMNVTALVSPASPYANSTLTCNVSVSNATSASYNVTVSWLKNGVVQGAYNSTIAVQNASSNSTSRQLNSSIAAKGEKWSCGAQATSPTQSSMVYSGNATVQNSPPLIAAQVSFSNASSSGHWFIANATASDTDGASDISFANISTTAGTCTYRSNSTSGNNFTASFNCTSASPATASVVIQFTDGSLASVSTSTAGNAYPDHPPSLSAPAITPATAYKNLSLTCAFGAFSDNDSDSENGSSRTFAWYMNGSLISGQTGYTLAASAFNKSDNLTCAISSSALTWNATNASANSSIVIQNSAPIVQADISAQNGSPRHLFNISATAYDADGVADIVSATAVVVQLNGTGSCSALSNSTSGGALTASFNCTTTAIGNWLNVSIRFNDSAGANATTSVLTYVPPNEPPSVTAPYITPASANKTTASLTCNGGNYSDPGNDTQGASSFRWYKNGELSPLAPSSAYPNTWFAAGDNLTCEETPRDSYGLAGAANNSSTITILSLAPEISAAFAYEYPTGGHFAYVNATALDYDGASTLSASATSSQGNPCSMVSSTITPPNTLYALFKCNGTALTSDNITIRFNDTGGLSASTSGNVTYPNQAPTQPGFLQPSGGQSYIGDAASNISATWSASTDADGDSLTYTLDYSPNSGTSWLSINASAASPYYWNASALAPNSTYRVRLTVSDSYATQNVSSTRDVTILSRNVFGNQSTLGGGLPSPAIEINGTAYNGTPAFDGEIPVAINITLSNSSSAQVVSFTYNFSETYINFTAMNITNGTLSGSNGSRAFIYVQGVDASAVVGTKSLTLYGVNTNYTNICVKDMDGATADSITSNCTGAYETNVSCDLTNQSGYLCAIDGTTLTVSGLSHSAVVQLGGEAVSPAGSTSASSSGGSDYSQVSLSHSFNCSSGALRALAQKQGGNAISGLEIRLKNPSASGWLSTATTSSDGSAIFQISEDGRYSLESAQTSGYLQGYTDSFALELCPPAQQPNATSPANPQTSGQATPQQNSTNVQPPPQDAAETARKAVEKAEAALEQKAKGGADISCAIGPIASARDALGRGNYSGAIELAAIAEGSNCGAPSSANQSSSQGNASPLAPSVPEEVKPAAGLGSAGLLCAGAGLLMAAIAAYVFFVRRKQKGL